MTGRGIPGFHAVNETWMRAIWFATDVFPDDPELLDWLVSARERRLRSYALRARRAKRERS